MGHFCEVLVNLDNDWRVGEFTLDANVAEKRIIEKTIAITTDHYHTRRMLGAGENKDINIGEYS